MEVPRLPLSLSCLDHQLQLLLDETRAMNGLVVMAPADDGLGLALRFVPFAKIDAFNGELRRRPGGGRLADRICQLLLEHYGSTAKPVLLLDSIEAPWLGMVPFQPERRERHRHIAHLQRCWSREAS